MKFKFAIENNFAPEKYNINTNLPQNGTGRPVCLKCYSAVGAQLVQCGKMNCFNLFLKHVGYSGISPQCKLVLVYGFDQFIAMESLG